jgi:hypothetical protein
MIVQWTYINDGDGRVWEGSDGDSAKTSGNPSPACIEY